MSQEDKIFKKANLKKKTGSFIQFEEEESININSNNISVDVPYRYTRKNKSQIIKQVTCEKCEQVYNLENILFNKF